MCHGHGVVNKAVTNRPIFKLSKRAVLPRGHGLRRLFGCTQLNHVYRRQPNSAALFCFLQCSRPAWSSLSLAPRDYSQSLNRFGLELKRTSLKTTTNVIRRRCDVSVILAAWYKHRNLLTYLLTYLLSNGYT